MNLEVRKQIENWYTEFVLVVPVGTRLHKVYWRRPDGYEGIVLSVPKSPEWTTPNYGKSAILAKPGDWVVLRDKDVQVCERFEVEE